MRHIEPGGHKGTQIMQRDEVFAQIRQIMARVFDCDPAQITDATKADDIAGWDSLTHLILLTGIEKRFDLSLPTEDAYAAQDVGQLVDLVCNAAAVG